MPGLFVGGNWGKGKVIHSKSNLSVLFMIVFVGVFEFVFVFVLYLYL